MTDENKQKCFKKGIFTAIQTHYKYRERHSSLLAFGKLQIFGLYFPERYECIGNGVRYALYEPVEIFHVVVGAHDGEVGQRLGKFVDVSVDGGVFEVNAGVEQVGERLHLVEGYVGFHNAPPFRVERLRTVVPLVMVSTVS